MPENSPQTYVITAVLIAFSVILHEIAHGYAAFLFGDKTAKEAGRLTLNPIKHVDLTGTIILPLMLWLVHAPFMFGWAKPVPVNFGALRQPKRDMVWVSLAGPATNLALGLLALFAVSVGGRLNFGNEAVYYALSRLFVLNLGLFVFNMFPVLPLDGGRVLTGILPLKAAIAFSKTERYGMPVMMFLLFILPMLGERYDIIGKYLSFGIGVVGRFLLNLFGFI